MWVGVISIAYIATPWQEWADGEMLSNLFVNEQMSYGHDRIDSTGWGLAS